MNVFAVPSKTPQKGESLSHDAATGDAVQGLIATFSDMLRNASVRMQSDAGSLTSQTKAETQAAARDAEAAERPRESRSERRDEATTASAERTSREREAGQRTRKNDTKPAEESAASEKAGRAKTPASAAPQEDAPARPTDGAERPAEPAEAAPDTAATGETEAPVDPAAPQDEAVAAVDPTAVPTEAAPVSAPADFVASVLATQLFAQSPATGADPASAAADTVSAVDDLSVAVIAAGQGNTAGDAKLAAAMAAAVPAATAATTAPATPQAILAGANAAADAPEGEAPTAGDTPLNAADLKVQQAAALSRLTGSGNLIAVRTTVAEPSAQLVSQPAATLSAPIIAATAEPATSAAPATAPAAQAAPPLNATVQATLAGTEASPLAQQNQQAEAQMARAPGASVAADAAKTIVQAAGPTASAGMQTSSGGGESLAGSGAQAALHTASASHAPQAQAASQPRFTVAQQAAVDQVSMQISKAVKDGVDRINIQLRPEHLGRVDVRLEVADGRVSATVTADSKETLDMLQKDARELERALQQAGLQTDTGSLNFSLRGQQGQGQGQEGDRQVTGGRSGQETLAAEETTAETPAWIDYPGGIRPDGRIDIRA